MGHQARIYKAGPNSPLIYVIFLHRGDTGVKLHVAALEWVGSF